MEQGGAGQALVCSENLSKGRDDIRQTGRKGKNLQSRQVFFNSIDLQQVASPMTHFSAPSLSELNGSSHAEMLHNASSCCLDDDHRSYRSFVCSSGGQKLRFAAGASAATQAARPT